MGADSSMELSSSIREPESADEPAGDAGDLRHSAGPHLYVWQDGWRYAPGLGGNGRNADSICAAGVAGLPRRAARQSADCRTGIDQVASATQPGGNMEGKETRFGIAASALFAAVATGRPLVR